MYLLYTVMALSALRFVLSIVLWSLLAAPNMAVSPFISCRVLFLARHGIAWMNALRLLPDAGIARVE